MAVCLRHVEAPYLKPLHEDDAEEHSGSGEIGAGRANTVVVAVFITSFAGCEATLEPADAGCAGVVDGSVNNLSFSGKEEDSIKHLRQLRATSVKDLIVSLDRNDAQHFVDVDEAIYLGDGCFDQSCLLGMIQELPGGLRVIC